MHHTPLQQLLKPRPAIPRAALHDKKACRRRYATFPGRRTKLRKTMIGASALVLGTAGYFYATDTRASIHHWLAVPLIQTLYPDAEDAHSAGTRALGALWKRGLYPRERSSVAGLEVDVFGYTLDNPLGISAGLDKHGDIPDELFALGAGIVEIGGITPKPQKGNPRPRVFRLASQEGIINRYGLNSEGAEAVAAKLRERVMRYARRNGFGDEDGVLNGAAGVPPGSLQRGKLLAVQVAKQETTPDGDIDAVRDDYVFGTKALAKYADIIVVNVSCPNAPGYRELQRVEPLTKILSGVVKAAKGIDREMKPAVMVKVSPDEDTEEQVSSICQAVYASGVDGVIVGNTTKRGFELLAHSRPTVTEMQNLGEVGGYSGPQLFERTVKLVGKYRRILDREGYNQTNTSHQPLVQPSNNHSTSSSSSSSSSSLSPPPQQKVIFCTGGIRSGEEALEVLNAGASVAQIYTAMVYGGVGQITKMKREMRDSIEEKSRER